MAKNAPTQVQVIPTPIPKGAGQLSIPPGKPPANFNFGGITVGGVADQNGPFRAPGVLVPAGMTVRIRANPANAGNAFVGLIREQVLNGRGDIIAPNTEIVYPIDNLAQLIFYFPNAGDGVVISIRNE